MPVTLQDLKSAAAALSIADRTELTNYLLDLIDQGETATIRSEWLRLAEDRMAEIKAGRVVGIPAEEVLKAMPGRRP